jgi:hypothetical protein
MPTRERRAQQLGVSVDRLPDGRGRHGNHCKGPRHYAWTKGKITNASGYVLIRAGESHPMADPNGYAPEHRLVMATAIGRALTSDEVVHHINGVRDDNRIENLQLMSVGEHSSLHDDMKHRDSLGRFVATREYPEAHHA